MSSLERLLSIMAQLRDPDGGCPWDLEQDFASISPHTIEEAYEVDEAIASGDLEALRDELGDLLFQVVFQARIAEEAGHFDFEGVVEAIVDKLIRRHPHIFAGAENPETAEGQRANWEAIKAAERAASGRKSNGVPDPFEGIPRSLPALARSAKVAGRLERLATGESVGASQTPAALLAAIEAPRQAMADRLLGNAESSNAKDLAAENARQVGEGLRAWVELARYLDLDPEQALRAHDDTSIATARGTQQET